MADLDSQYSHLNLCEITLCEEIVGRTKNGNKGSSFRSTEALNIETEYFLKLSLDAFVKLENWNKVLNRKADLGNFCWQSTDPYDVHSSGLNSLFVYFLYFLFSIYQLSFLVIRIWVIFYWHSSVWGVIMERDSFMGYKGYWPFPNS